jgi:hypothetical protein
MFLNQNNIPKSASSGRIKIYSIQRGQASPHLMATTEGNRINHSITSSSLIPNTSHIQDRWLRIWPTTNLPSTVVGSLR